MKIAVAGKGGVGKTTFTALLIRQLVEKQKGAVLAVDADPNSNLNEALGIEVDASIADILDEVKGGKAIPEGMPKDVYVEYRLNQVLNETDYVDLVVMGVPQGSGCYCYPNDLMRKYLENLRQNYDYVVIDNEAGMEHLARRVVTDIDYLFVVSDASARGIRSAGRVFDIVKTVGINVKNIYLVVTKVLPSGIEALMPEIENTGLEVIGSIPYDEEVAKYDLAGKPLVQLPAEAPSVVAVKEIFEKLAL